MHLVRSCHSDHPLSSSSYSVTGLCDINGSISLFGKFSTLWFFQGQTGAFSAAYGGFICNLAFILFSAIMMKLNIVCLVARPLTGGGFWRMKLNKNGELRHWASSLFDGRIFIFIFIILGGSWNYSIPFSPLHFTFHISTCIPSSVLTPLAKNKEKFMSSKALIMIPNILLERRIEMSIKGGGGCLVFSGCSRGWGRGLMLVSSINVFLWTNRN